MPQCPRHPNLSGDELLQSADKCFHCLSYLGELNFKKLQPSPPPSHTEVSAKRPRGRPRKNTDLDEIRETRKAIEDAGNKMVPASTLPNTTTQTRYPRDANDFDHLAAPSGTTAKYKMGQHVFVLTYKDGIYGVDNRIFTIVEGPIKWNPPTRWDSYRVEATPGDHRVYFECNIHRHKEHAIKDAALRNSVLENIKSQTSK